MAQAAGKLRQGTQNKGVLLDVGTGQLERVLRRHQIVVQQQIQIQLPGREAGLASVAPVFVLDGAQRPQDLVQGHGGVASHHQIVKIVAVEAHGLVFIDRRGPHIVKNAAQGRHPRPEALFPFLIAADADENPRHFKA